MFHFVHRWLFKRRQRAGAYRLPHSRRGTDSFHSRFNSYLAQTSVRGRDFERFDLPRRRRLWMRIFMVSAGTILVVWFLVESIRALSLF